MQAVKDNKVYKISEAQKSLYLKQGYNITDDAGKILEYSPTATVPYNEYAKVKAELVAVKEELVTANAQIEVLKVAKTEKTAKSKE